MAGRRSLSQCCGDTIDPMPCWTQVENLSTEASWTLRDLRQFAERREALGVMERYSAVVLELAATAMYLQRNGYDSSAWKEVEKRKGSKLPNPT